MKSAAIALAIGTMLTVEQRDANHFMSEHASVAVSADGRFVAFTTYSRLVPADTDDWSDVYVLDRERQRVTLESADTAGFTGDVSYPGISGDGRHVVFERANGVMRRDRRDGVTRLIAEGRQPVMTDTGHFVAPPDRRLGQTQRLRFVRGRGGNPRRRAAEAQSFSFQEFSASPQAGGRSQLG